MDLTADAVADDGKQAPCTPQRPAKASPSAAPGSTETIAHSADTMMVDVSAVTHSDEATPAAGNVAAPSISPDDSRVAVSAPPVAMSSETQVSAMLENVGKRMRACALALCAGCSCVDELVSACLCMCVYARWGGFRAATAGFVPDAVARRRTLQ